MRLENRRTYTFDVFSWRNRTRISANRGEAPSEGFQYVPAMSRCAIVRGRSTPSIVSRHVYLVAHFHGNIIILRLSTTDTLNLACQTRGFASDEKPLSLWRETENSGVFYRRSKRRAISRGSLCFDVFEERLYDLPLC